MVKKTNTEFENTLQDILKAGEPDKTGSDSTDTETENRPEQSSTTPLKKSSRYPKWLDNLIRIIAFIVVFFLLFKFAFNIALR